MFKINLSLTVDQMVALFKKSGFRGFVGDTCKLCKHTANVVLATNWLCEGCGEFNLLLSKTENPLHESPDYGPEAALIRKAENLARIQDEHQE